MARNSPRHRCRVCKKTCPCLIYGRVTPHVHLPGGVRGWPLCHEHQEECLKVHRQPQEGGGFKWIACGAKGCGYCRAVKRLCGERS